MAVQQKTNVMRILEQKKIAYTAHAYAHEDGAVDGCTVAQLLGLDPGMVFKTLVTRGAGGGCYVFVIPVAEKLDLRRAARAVGEKSVAMIPMRELLPLTGYIHGGCSPVGMKKPFPTAVDETAMLYDTIVVSAGKIGAQVELAPDDLLHLTGGQYAALTTED
ncbi:MAG: Cys-tRNA(Pro) deacylase [Clostridiales bacterium]|nr:Cys-tRNA(Pro) deacylase [Clostridiales bacterium]